MPTTAVRETRTALRTKMAIRKDGGTQLESLISRARALPMQGRELPDVTLPDSVVFREAGSRDVLTSLARFAGISIVFDPQFRSVPMSIDLRGSTLPVGAGRDRARDRHLLARHRTEHGHGGARHGRQAPRVRRGSDPHVLPEQRGPQGNTRPAAHRRRRAAPVADHGDQRDLDQGHARAHRGRRHG